MRCVEFVVKCSLVELVGDGLAWHQSALTDEQSSFRIECGDGENNLLRSVLLQSALALLDEAEKEAYSTRTQALVLS